MRPTKVLLTGATGGLGQSLAQLFASKNIPQILVGRDFHKLSALNIPQSKIFVSDLCDRKPLIELLWKEQPDLIINNAGFGLYGEATTLTTVEQLSIFEINAKALMEITIEGAKMLLHENKRGMILNISSMAGEIPTPIMSAYGASKAFVTHFSKSMDYECRSKGVRILVSCPGQFNSGFSSNAAKKTITPSNLSFSAERLSQRIWKQILKEKSVDIFDFRYRLLHGFTKYLLLESWVAKVISKNLKRRLDRFNS